MSAPFSLRGAALALIALALCASCGESTPTAAESSAHTESGSSASSAASLPASASTSTSTPNPTPTPDPDSVSDDPIVVIDETGAEITIESVERIIPLDGTVAEVVFALGLGDNVIATDLSATYPAAADALPEIGYQRSLVAEPIAAMEPTVLLATDIAGPPESLDDLRALGYPVVIVPNEATRAGPGQKIRSVGRALGVPERADELALSVERAIDDAAVSGEASVDSPPRIVALYLRGKSAQLVLGESSATHWLIEAAGGIDLAGELGVSETAPISAESLLLADPEVILVSTSGLESVGGVEGLFELDGLARTSAAATGRVIAFPDQLLLGNGPRAGEMLAELRTELEAMDE